jgi:hypothetical protein
MDKKGIALYLIVTFGLGYAAQIGCLLIGLISLTDASILQSAVAAALLFIPAVGAFAASQAAPDPALRLAPTWPLPLGAALRLAILVPVIFLASYALTSFLGWTEVQWNMGVLVNRLASLSQEFQMPPLSAEVAAMIPVVALTAGPLIALALGLTIFAAVAWGSEVGWRGYLLPRLLPLGQVPAYGIVGALWALWFFPLIVAWYGSYTDPQMLFFAARFLAFGIVFGIFLGEVHRASNHLGLVAIAVGSFAAQLMGVWEYLFQFSMPPWTGPFGIVAIVCWLAASAVVSAVVGRPQAAPAKSAAKAQA